MQKSLEQTDKALNAVAQLMNGVAQSLKEVLSIISAGTLVASSIFAKCLWFDVTSLDVTFIYESN